MRIKRIQIKLDIILMIFSSFLQEFCVFPSEIMRFYEAEKQQFC
jgi:hypothetical protein